jgi:hypothetical protein
MYFDFDSRYDDYEPIGGKIRRWDGVLLSVGVHTSVILLVLFAPALPFLTPDPAKVVAVEPKPQERPRFVFVQPRLDLEAPKPPKRAEDSDKHRLARSEAPRVPPANELPFARGNSAERREATREERSAGKGPAPTEPPLAPDVATRAPDPLSEMRTSQPRRRRSGRGSAAGRIARRCARNLQSMRPSAVVQQRQGAVQNPGPRSTPRVDSVRDVRFIAQCGATGCALPAAMSPRVTSSHVQLHRNGALTDVQVIQGAPIDSFNTAAMNALLASNPTEPLPPEYPADKAFFTVTFYYNESPGGQ